MSPVVRDAHPEHDGPACAAIYAPYVRDTAISFEEEPPAAEEMARRMREYAQAYPWLVAEEDGVIVGYAYGSWHRARAAYRWAVDVAVYVDANRRRRGVGRALYEGLIEGLRAGGYRIACAGVTLPNDASVALHEALGFRAVGTYHRVGWKLGRWHDVSWWELDLAPGTVDPPREPGQAAGRRTSEGSGR